MKLFAVCLAIVCALIVGVWIGLFFAQTPLIIQVRLVSPYKVPTPMFATYAIIAKSGETVQFPNQTIYCPFSDTCVYIAPDLQNVTINAPSLEGGPHTSSAVTVNQGDSVQVDKVNP